MPHLGSGHIQVEPGKGKCLSEFDLALRAGLGPPRGDLHDNNAVKVTQAQALQQGTTGLQTPSGDEVLITG